MVPEDLRDGGLVVFALRAGNDTLTVRATEDGVIDGEGHWLPFGEESLEDR